MAESSLNGYKTLWEKEKLFVTRNFSFSRSVFKRLLLQTHKNQGLFGKGLKCLWSITVPFTNSSVQDQTVLNVNSSSSTLYGKLIHLGYEKKYKRATFGFLPQDKLH